MATILQNTFITKPSRHVVKRYLLLSRPFSTATAIFGPARFFPTPRSSACHRPVLTPHLSITSRPIATKTSITRQAAPSSRSGINQGNTLKPINPTTFVDDLRSGMLVGYAESEIQSVREIYKNTLYPEKWAEHMRTLEGFLLSTVEHGRASSTVGKNSREQERLAQVFAGAEELAKSAGELADEIEKWNNWPRAIWRRTGGRIWWTGTVAINLIISMIFG